MITPVLDNMNEVENLLKEDQEAKDIDWTTVLPAGLTNEPATGTIWKALKKGDEVTDE